MSLVSIGAESAPPAHSTPGSDAMRSITSWKNRAWRRGSGYLEGGSITKAVRRFFGLNPRSTCCTRTKLRTNRPAPASSISASAISATTSTLRALARVEPIVNRLPDFLSESCKSVLDPCSAGAMPKISAVPSVSTTLKISTCGSIVVSLSLGISGASRMKRSTPW